MDLHLVSISTTIYQDAYISKYLSCIALLPGIKIGYLCMIEFNQPVGSNL